jgi:hypothetical protein
LFVLGHLGIGSRMLLRLRRRLPVAPLFLGCLLPDLIDKPLFYGLVLLRGAPGGLITGTRSFGHTGLFFLSILLAAAVARRPAMWALVAGMATHLALDIGGELAAGADPASSIWLAIFFPALGWRFPLAHFGSLLEHLIVSAQSAYVILGELVGGAILIAAWLRRRRTQSS